MNPGMTTQQIQLALANLQRSQVTPIQQNPSILSMLVSFFCVSNKLNVLESALYATVSPAAAGSRSGCSSACCSDENSYRASK